MNKLFLTSIAAIAMCCPAIADPVTPKIAPGTNPAACTQPVLGTTSGTSNLEAKWTANTLNLEWYDDTNGNKITPNNNAANTCTYDSGITVPSNTISKTGYTFAGWQVKVAPAGFDLSTLNPSYGGYLTMARTLNGESCLGSETYWDDDDYEYRTRIFGDIFGATGTCNTDSRFSGLNAGEWVTEFNYGRVKGVAYCSGKSGNNNGKRWNNSSSNWKATESELTSASGETRYCWCKAIGYDADSDGEGTYLPVTSSSWIYGYDEGTEAKCASGCADYCSGLVEDYSAMRSAIYGIVQ